ncbi:MAG: S49 family peptidase, partial [Acidiferrobacterales bacterium]
EKLKEEIEDTHELFKNFVAENRPELDIKRIATGEHWYGTRALELRLINDLQTSDDYLLAANKNADLYEVIYTTKKTLSEKLVANMQSVVDNALLFWWQQTQQSKVM